MTDDLRRFLEENSPGSPLLAMPAPMPPTELFAWVGPHETDCLRNSGEVGIQHLPPGPHGGPLKLVSIRGRVMELPRIVAALQARADATGDIYRLVRFVAVSEVLRIEPQTGSEAEEARP